MPSANSVEILLSYESYQVKSTLKRNLIFQSNLLRWLRQLRLEADYKDRVQSIREKRYFVDVNGVRSDNPLELIR